MKVSTSDSSAIGSRLKAAREALGLTQEGLAAAVGGSKRGIQNNEALKSVPGGEVIAGLVGLGINANWLLTGEGEMRLAEPRIPADDKYDIPQVLRRGEVAGDAIAAQPQAAAYGAPASIDGLLLQKVTDVFLAWLEENRDNVRINRSRWGGIISILYLMAMKSGKIEKAELEQVLSMVA